MTVEQDIVNLQKQINELKGKTDSPFTTAVTTNPFTTLKKLDLEQGSTGSARFRKLSIPLHAATQNGALLSSDSHGSISGMYHADVNDSGTQLIISLPIPLPSDYVPGGAQSISFLYSNSTNSNEMVLSFSLKGFNSGSSSLTTLMSVADTEFTVPSTADTMLEVKTDLTVLPDIGDSVIFTFSRNGAAGGDDNAGTMSLWLVWMNYLAYN